MHSHEALSSQWEQEKATLRNELAAADVRGGDLQNRLALLEQEKTSLENELVTARAKNGDVQHQLEVCKELDQDIYIRCRRRYHGFGRVAITIW